MGGTRLAPWFKYHPHPPHPGLNHFTCTCHCHWKHDFVSEQMKGGSIGCAMGYSEKQCTDVSLNSRFPTEERPGFRISGREVVFFFLENHQAFQTCRGVCSSSFQFTPQQGGNGKRNKWCQENMTDRQANTCWGPWWPSCDDWRGRADALTVLMGRLERRIHPNHCDTCYLYACPWRGCVMMAVWILGALKPCGKAICPSMSHHP